MADFQHFADRNQCNAFTRGSVRLWESARKTVAV
jgi:hypothetical protein